MKIKYKGVKIYRKLRYRKGFGIHSPFVYNFITKVIEEKSSYYLCDEIVKKWKNATGTYHFPDQIASIKTQHPKYGALLFRIVNFFQCESVLEIGASTGAMTIYLALAKSNCQCIALEENEGLSQFIQTISKQNDLNNLTLCSGNYQENINEIVRKKQLPKMIFINKIQNDEHLEAILSMCLPHVTNETFLLIDGIHKTKERKKTWMNLTSNPQVKISIDLYDLGIVFFKDKLHKQHYKTHFDNGKEQDLYKNRRWRFNLFGWRKKSSKNKHPTGSLWYNR